MLKILRSIGLCVILLSAVSPLWGEEVADQSQRAMEKLHHEESMANVTRKFLGLDAVFLKVLLMGTETYSWALELGAHGSGASALSSAGSAGLASGTLQGMAMGAANLAVGLSMSNLMTGAAVVGVLVVSSAVVEEWKDRLAKSAVRMSALASIPHDVLGGAGQNEFKLGSETFTQLATKADKRRVKYHCKRSKAIHHAQNGKIKDALFCIWNNPAPKDYLCEFLAHMKPEYKNIIRNKVISSKEVIELIAPVFKDVMINVYRRILKYRFLDKYYTAINDDYEGLVQLRSATNIADRLNASEFWMPESSINLIDTLKQMHKESKMMKGINSCHKNGCDERSQEQKRKEKVLADTLNPSEHYENYCEYYFRKSPVNLGILRNTASKGLGRVLGRESTQEESQYITEKKMEREELIENAGKNLNLLFTVVDNVDAGKQMSITLQSIERLADASARYEALLKLIPENTRQVDRDEKIRLWMSDPQNRKAYHTLRGTKDRLIDDRMIAGQDDDELSKREIDS